MSNYTQRLIWFGNMAFACDIKHQTVAYESFCYKFKLNQDKFKDQITIKHYDRYQYTPHKKLYPFIDIDNASKLLSFSKLPTATTDFNEGINTIKILHNELFKEFKEEVSAIDQPINIEQSDFNDQRVNTGKAHGLHENKSSDIQIRKAGGNVTLIKLVLKEIDRMMLNKENKQTLKAHLLHNQAGLPLSLMLPR